MVCRAVVWGIPLSLFGSRRSALLMGAAAWHARGVAAVVLSVGGRRDKVTVFARCMLGVWVMDW